MGHFAVLDITKEGQGLSHICEGFIMQTMKGYLVSFAEDSMRLVDIDKTQKLDGY